MFLIHGINYLAVPLQWLFAYQLITLYVGLLVCFNLLNKRLVNCKKPSWIGKTFVPPAYTDLLKKFVNGVLVCLAYCYCKGGEGRKLRSLKLLGIYKRTNKSPCAVTTNS